MRIIKKWIGRKPESAGDVYLLEVTQAEMFEQMYPLLGQLALHATSGRGLSPVFHLRGRTQDTACG